MARSGGGRIVTHCVAKPVLTTIAMGGGDGLSCGGGGGGANSHTGRDGEKLGSLTI
jgi:hypothetical protein